jgi:hypothetical protein
MAAMALAAAAVLWADAPGEWQFALGRPGEHLRAAASDMPPAEDTVTLPHRVLQPNRALWYARTVAMPDGAALRIDADDGAQVFVDGVQWRQRRGVFVADAPAPAGERRVIVRVLNNAMMGGLRRVALAAPPPGTSDPGATDAASAFDPVDSPAFLARMPAPGRPCRFALWADSQGGWDTFSALTAAIDRRSPHFAAGIGDLVNDGSDPSAWARLVGILRPLAARVAVVPIAGNHDYDGFYDDLRSRGYERLIGRTESWFAWTCGAARLVAIDLNREFPIGMGVEQSDWLRREVRSPEWREASWRVLLVHQPPWSRSWSGYDGDESTRAIVRDLVEHHGLQLVASGHSHAYEHLVRTVDGRPVHVLITGGGGGGLEPAWHAPADPDRVDARHHVTFATATTLELSIEAEDAAGTVFDRWSIRR